MNDDRLKLWMGFALVIVVAVLAALIGVGTLQSDVKVGGGVILGAVSKVIIDWGMWAFSGSRDKGTGKENDHGPQT